MDRDEFHALVNLAQDYLANGLRSETFSEERLGSLLRAITPYIFMIPIEYSDFAMLRARNTPRGTSFEHVRQLGYPPIVRSNSIQRCNLPREQIFYGSSNVETSLLEVGFTEDRPCAVIAQFSLRAASILKLLPIGEIDHLRRYGRLRMPANGVKERLEEALKGLEFYHQNAYEFVDALLADLFSRDKNVPENSGIYETTARISKMFLSLGEVDGIIYPSVRHAGGVNFAVLPRAFDKNFVIKKFMLTSPVRHSGYGIFEFFEHATGQGLDDQGRLIWLTNPHFNARATWPESADQ